MVDGKTSSYSWALQVSDHKNLQQDHCRSITNGLMMVAAVTETSTKMSFTVIALAVIFIIRLFSTSTFRQGRMQPVSLGGVIPAIFGGQVS